jgi:hypothetical protein
VRTRFKHGVATEAFLQSSHEYLLRPVERSGAAIPGAGFMTGTLRNARAEPVPGGNPAPLAKPDRSAGRRLTNASCKRAGALDRSALSDASRAGTTLA